MTKKIKFIFLGNAIVAEIFFYFAIMVQNLNVSFFSDGIPYLAYLHNLVWKKGVTGDGTLTVESIDIQDRIEIKNFYVKVCKVQL